jgi:hypothetical protein
MSDAPIAAEAVFPDAPNERWQHGQHFIAAGKLYPQAVKRGVLLLRKSGDIGDAELVAAERFHRDYVLGVLGARDPERRATGNAPDAHTGQLARVRASQTHGAVSDLLGAGMTARLVAFLVDDRSLGNMAAEYHPQRERTDGLRRLAGQMATLLTVLAGLYAAVDGTGEKRRTERKTLDGASQQ